MVGKQIDSDIILPIWQEILLNGEVLLINMLLYLNYSEQRMNTNISENQRSAETVKKTLALIYILFISMYITVDVFASDIYF